MTARVIDAKHPVATAVARARGDLREVALRPLWSMDPRQTAEALVHVTQLAAQVAQLQLALLHHAEVVEVGADVGATSPASWLAHETRTTRAVTHRAARLAKRLATAHPAVDIALADAGVTVEQAHVIVEAVDALPTDLVDPDTVRRAEEHLLSEARHHDARALRVLGRRLLEVVAPDVADHGSILRKHLVALAAPGRNPDLPAEAPSKQKLGLAFLDYVETRPDDTVPRSGGIAATVVVTMTLETLLGGLRAASLCDGTRISAGEARRLACGAGIVPVVLGGASEPLDVGRRRRFHSRPMRIALGVRDGGCSTVGCDRPPSMCHAHHDVPWSEGGPTDVASGRLLCTRHHTLAHDRRYQMKSGPGGRVTFTRRT